MKVSNRELTIKLSRRELRNLSEELDDLNFGADDMTGKKQSDEKWPTLGALFELVQGEA